MPYAPKVNAPIPVPPDLLPALRFSWPGAPDPSGFLGIGAIGSVGAPNQYDFPASNAPTGREPYTMAATITFSSQAEATDRRVMKVGSGQSFLVALSVNSGIVKYAELSENGTAVGFNASRSTLAGDVAGAVVVRNPLGGRFVAVYLDGTLVSSQGDCASWTAQYSLSIGHAGANVYSHGVANVAIFTRALIATEVGVLDRRQVGR